MALAQGLPLILLLAGGPALAFVVLMYWWPRMLDLEGTKGVPRNGGS